VRLGLRAAGAVSVAVASATVVPTVRAGMGRRRMPAPVSEWLLVRIPIGTVWSEEAAFRAALGTVAARAFGPTWGRILQSAAFGLSHVADARGAGETVVGTVAVTGVAGWVFGWLYDRSDSLVAPMLAHLAVNEAGAVAALVVQRLGDWGMAARRVADPTKTRDAVSAVAEWLRDETVAVPERSLIADAVRLTARTLAAQAPGASVEVRVPPFVAVQCISGLAHTRGNPPNVVETDARTWLRLATGLLAMSDALANGTLQSSGSRAGEIADWLPVVPLVP
jgi:uncharacterized SCP-like protein/CAAX prenyl protease-like protein